MGKLMADLTARTRTSVRLNLAEMNAILAVAGQHRGSPALASAVRRVAAARDRKRTSVYRAGR